MSRGIGEFEPIQEQIPEWLAVFVALITQLGDVWFLFLLLIGLYWFRPDIHDSLTVVAGLYLAALGTVVGLKEVFGLPRPQEPLLDPALLPAIIEPLYELTASASGYGFPSGHATNATVVYLGLALILPISTMRRRLLGGGALVVIISFSRVALGVHYLVDILAGFVVGASLLFIGFRLTDRLSLDRGTAIFGLAIGTTLFYLVVSDFEADAVLLLGVTLGVFGGWQLVMLARTILEVGRPSALVVPAGIRLTLIVLTLGPLFIAIEEFPILVGQPYAEAGLLGLGAAAVLIIPIARYSPHVQRVIVGIRFWMFAVIRELRPLTSPATWRRGWDRLLAYLRRYRE